MNNRIEELHDAAASLLEDPGVKIEHDGIYDLLVSKGCKEGAGSSVVRFPRKLVEEYVKMCPREFVFPDRFGKGKTISPDGDPVIWSVPGLNILERGVYRPFTSADMARWTRLLHHLPNVDGVFGYALEDVPPKIRDVVGLRVMAENTTKHIRVLCFSPEGSDALVEMKKVVGAHPWFSIGFTAHGPLRWTNLALEIFRRTAGHGIPVTVNGEPMAGVSGPVTIAGSAAVGTAEILAGIVLNQALEPGRPCVFNLGLAHTFDMRTAVAVTGGPENALYAQLAAALGRFYNIPSASWVSTESMCPDSQAALEKMFGFAAHMAEGVSNIWSVGQLESELSVSPAQAVMDDEMISFVKRYLRGVRIDKETLAVDITREVGIAGSYLAETHTMDHFKEELFMPELLFRSKRSDWETAGKKTLEQRAEERAAKLMEKPAPHGLSVEQLAALDGIVERSRKALK
jgi:trimethylamine--corrinoid protein Co-methyltransferase